jgi:eukaryotic-like serine/threonine-protein kinase
MPKIIEKLCRGQVIGDRYRIINKIAEGGVGETYRAEQTFTKGIVCIKHCSKVDPAYQQVLMDEATLMDNLHHYLIPGFRDAFILPDGSCVLVMSYFKGITLEAAVQKVGKLEPEAVSWIAERVLNALVYIWEEKRLVHGDIKPLNIILQPWNHRACLVDYGLSVIRTRSGSGNKGYTADYASPEGLWGHDLSAGSDFYSLGLSMIYALSGDMGLVKAREVPSSTPRPLMEFIHRLIVRDIRNRPSWETENLWSTIKHVRKDAFGQSHSKMKPIPGISAKEEDYE